MRTASCMGGSRFRIEPNPPQAGKPVTVTYIGPALVVEYQVDDDEPVRVKPDENGKFTIDPLPPGDELMLTDNLGQPGYLHANITSAP